MNFFWNIRNASNSSRITITVAAERSAHWAPISPICVNLTSPAVNGLALSDFVIISGHRNSFQCQLIDDIPNAVMVETD